MRLVKREFWWTDDITVHITWPFFRANYSYYPQYSVFNFSNPRLLETPQAIGKRIVKPVRPGAGSIGKMLTCFANQLHVLGVRFIVKVSALASRLARKPAH